MRRFETPLQPLRTAVRPESRPGSLKESANGKTADDPDDCDARRGYECRVPPPNSDHSSCLRTVDGQLLKELLEENYSLRQEVAALRSQSLSLSEVKSRPVLFKHVTGLPNYETFAALLRYLEAKAIRLKWWRGMVTLR